MRTTWLVGAAWLFAVFGLGWAVLLSFAGSMRTVPDMSLGEALLTTPAPLLALALVGTVMARVRRGEAARRLLYWSVPAALAAGLALLVGWSLFLQLGLS